MSHASADLAWWQHVARPGAEAAKPAAAPTTPRAGPGGSWNTEELNGLRDELMTEYLRVAAGEGVPDLRVGYSQRWWDGAAWSACLELEWHGTRWRVVRDDDELVALPWRALQARRLLRRRRRPDPAPRLAPLLRGQVRATPALAAVHVLGRDDAVRVMAHRRELDSRLTAGPGPCADPRQGVLAFGPGDPAPVMLSPLVPAPRGKTSVERPVVIVEQEGDWTACRHPACGGMSLLPAPGSTIAPEECCPSCKRR